MQLKKNLISSNLFEQYKINIQCKKKKIIPVRKLKKKQKQLYNIFVEIIINYKGYNL